MIICEETKDVSTSENFESSNFTILASSKAFQILSSNVYTKKVRAIVREISTNAQDAHVEAGVTRPFKVHLPTHLEPWFSVRDYGTGISNENMFSLYTQFFKSTRTSSNDFCGALGIGRMAPFTIVDSFIVNSYQNGIKRSYCVYKDEKGLPRLSLLSSSDTHEPNGLEVHVQVEKYLTEEFKTEAAFVYAFFENMPEINDPTVFQKIQENNKFDIELDDYKINYKSKHQYHELYAVMGNVAYSIDYDAYIATIPFELYGQIKFDMGTLSFNPGRESLSLDEATLAEIKKKLSRLRNAVVKDSIEKFSKIENKFEKYLEAKKIDIHEVKKSQEWIDAVSYYETENKDLEYEMHYHYHYRTSVKTKYTTAPQDNCEYYIKDPKIKIAKERIRSYVKTHKISVAFVSQEIVDHLQIPASRIFTADRIPKIHRQRSASTTPRQKVDKINCMGTLVTGVMPPTGTKVYVEKQGLGLKYSHPAWMNTISNLGHAVKFLLKQKMIDSSFEVYIVNSTLSKTKKFQNDTSWVKFEDFFRQKVDGLVFQCYNDENFNDSLMDKLEEIYDKVPSLRNKLSFVKEYKDINVDDMFWVRQIINAGVIKSEVHPVCKKIKDFERSFPMIDLIDRYTLTYMKDFSVITNYINGSGE